MANEKGVASPYNLRVPPQDTDAEKALLGSIMLKPDVFVEVNDTIRPEAFYVAKHRIIYKAMQDLFANSDAIDLLTVSSKLKEQSKLDSIGGASYLTELANGVPSASNVHHYADIVQKKSARRQLIEAAENISEMGYDEASEFDSVFDKIGKKIFDITTSAKKKFLTMKDSLAEAMERINHLQDQEDEIRGVPTGFADLDNKLAGFQKSDLIILAARPSLGKTSLALDIARHSALNHGSKVGIFSLEMSSQQLVDRMLAAEAKVDSWKLRTGRFSNDSEFESLQEALGRLSKASIFIDDDPNNDVMKLRSSARRMKLEHGLDLIIIDYLQLMVPRSSNSSLVEQVTEISRSLKGIARELDVPVLALSQLNRNVEQRGGKPKLSDLRDSGSIEQDADVVMFIHRDAKEDGPGRSNTAEILIEKHRNGPTGKIDLYFNDKLISYTTLEKGDFGEF